MKSKEVFNKKNMDIFMPGGVELLYHVLQNVGYDQFESMEARNYGLQVVSELLDLKLIEVFHWGDYH